MILRKVQMVSTDFYYNFPFSSFRCWEIKNSNEKSCCVVHIKHGIQKESEVVVPIFGYNGQIYISSASEVHHHNKYTPETFLLTIAHLKCIYKYDLALHLFHNGLRKR